MTATGTPAKSHQLSSILGLGASRVYNHNLKMALEPQCPTGKHTACFLSVGQGPLCFLGWRGKGDLRSYWWTDIAREILAGLSPSPHSFPLVCLGLTCIP